MGSAAPVVLITGCSSGIGKALCRQFHRNNCRVIATARSLESLEGLRTEGLDIKKLDVTNGDDITSVVRSVLEENNRIDILINNAGYAQIGPTVELSDIQLKSQLETNLISPLALVRQVAPVMKNNGQGKIVNVGSISGIVSTPFSGAYCASKAALHSLSDALRMELSPFGIQVIMVQPGAIESKFGKAAASTVRDSLKPDSWYTSIRQAIYDRAELSQKDATPAQEFAEVVVKILLRDRPPPIIRSGKQSRFLPMLKHLLPISFFDGVLMKKFKLDTIRN